jgi:hypothetical protein
MHDQKAARHTQVTNNFLYYLPTCSLYGYAAYHGNYLSRCGYLLTSSYRTLAPAGEADVTIGCEHYIFRWFK